MPHGAFLTHCCPFSLHINSYQNTQNVNESTSIPYDQVEPTYRDWNQQYVQTLHVFAAHTLTHTLWCNWWSNWQESMFLQRGKGRNLLVWQLNTWMEIYGVNRSETRAFTVSELSISSSVSGPEVVQGKCLEQGGMKGRGKSSYGPPL